MLSVCSCARVGLAESALRVACAWPRRPSCGPALSTLGNDGFHDTVKVQLKPRLSKTAHASCGHVPISAGGQLFPRGWHSGAPAWQGAQGPPGACLLVPVPSQPMQGSRGRMGDKRRMQETHLPPGCFQDASLPGSASDPCAPPPPQEPRTPRVQQPLPSWEEQTLCIGASFLLAGAHPAACRIHARGTAAGPQNRLPACLKKHTWEGHAFEADASSRSHRLPGKPPGHPPGPAHARNPNAARHPVTAW